MNDMLFSMQSQDGPSSSAIAGLERIDITAGEPVIEAAGGTHPGRIRDRNEDAFEVDEALGLAVIADGLGGHAAGHVASKTAVREVRMHLRASGLSSPRRQDRPAAPAPATAHLAEAVQQANKTICAMSREIPAFSGMKTTIAAVLWARRSVLLAHVGDSRIYRLRAGKLEKLTEDHSLAAEYLRVRGEAADLEVARQAASQLTRCLGKSPEVRVSTHVESYQPGDAYLLCTDGLWGLVEEEAMTQAILGASDLAHAVERLIDLANELAGSDNITAVLVRSAQDEGGNPAFDAPSPGACLRW